MPSTEHPTKQTVNNTSRVGCVLAVAALSILGLLAAVVMPFLARMREATHPDPTRMNLQQLGISFAMYTNDSVGKRWPAFSSNDTVWAPALRGVYPEHLNDPGTLVSGEHPDFSEIRTTLYAVADANGNDYVTLEGLMGLSFAYLGWAVKDKDAFDALAKARQSGLLQGEPDNLRVPGYEQLLVPLRTGIERFFITDINGPPGAPEAAMRATIPVLVEVASWTYKQSEESYPGAYVLYMDGRMRHVELGTFPVLPEVLDVLTGLSP